jgi:glucose/arabinose dehydrogenase
MRRSLLLLIIPLLVACGSPGTPAVSTPHLAADPETTTPALTETVLPIPPTETEAPPPTAIPIPSFPDPANFTWATLAGGVRRPVDIQNAGDGSGRLFILEQSGRILLFQGGEILSTPFLDITGQVGSSGNEQGLLGLAFHPDYPENGLFFVNYTDRGGDTRIARFNVSDDPNIADPVSETLLLAVPQPYSNHNGGVLAFGPDGYLYAGLGDGGSQGDPSGNAQNTDTVLGKILRLDVDSGALYSIPPGNSFGNEVWAYGLRNPWRFSFDRLTSDLYIGDVGQGTWEEIDFLPAGSNGGANFGWNMMEGNHPYKGSEQPGLIPPVAEYSHSEGGCSVTGGYVYRGQDLPEWQGIYLYGDYCTGLIWGLIRSENGWQSKLLFDTDFSISSFGVDEAGELYITDLQGAIHRLERK